MTEVRLTIKSHPSLDLRVATVKWTWLLQVKSSRFSSKSPPKFPLKLPPNF